MAGDALQQQVSEARVSAGSPASVAPGGTVHVPPARQATTNDPAPVTPFDVVHESGLLRLRRYEPAVARTAAAPVLLVYSLIKRPYILDLLEERSVVGNLLRQGFTVYLTEWVPPAASDAARGFKAYVDQDLAEAVEHIRRRERAERVSLVGSCIGGLLSAVYTALYPETVRDLVPLAMPFRMPPSLFPGAVEYVVKAYGNVPAWFIRAALSTSVPMRANLPVYLAQDLAEDPAATGPAAFKRLHDAVERWMASDVPVAGRIFCEIMRDAYQDTQLAESRLDVGGRRVVLGNITCPVLNVTGERDPLVPPWTSAGFVEAVGSREASNLVFPVGHLGLMVSLAAHERLWPQIGAWLERGTAG